MSRDDLDGFTVIRIDETTGANLWLANHAVGARRRAIAKP